MAFFILTGAAGHAAAPEIPTYTVTVTAYNAVPSQTDENPFVTASGAYSNPAVVAARSRDLADTLPFGTVIEIETPDRSDTCGYSVVSGSVGYRVIADSMNARIQNTVDVLLPEVSSARTLGSCKDVTIRVVGHIDLSKPSNLPKSQSALAALVDASGLALK